MASEDNNNNNKVWSTLDKWFGTTNNWGGISTGNGSGGGVQSVMPAVEQKAQNENKNLNGASFSHSDGVIRFLDNGNNNNNNNNNNQNSNGNGLG